MMIPKDRVLCPGDFTGYMCTMSGFTTGAVNQETNQVYVTYTVYPTTIEMPTLRIVGEFSDTPSRQFPVGTAVQLTCTGQIGSEQSATIRWCSKKSQALSFTGLPETPVHSEASPSGCQYTRSSTITYNLTSSDTYTQFLCESGYSGLCETGTAKQYLNISLEGSITSTHSLPKSVSTNVYPTTIEMPTVRILGEFSDAPSRQFPVGTAVELTCTGQISSDPTATIRWCSKKSHDLGLTGLPQTPVHSVASLSGCQYTRSSTITYNLTSDDTYTQFLCESGYSGLCETGTAKQYLNMSIEGSFISTHRLPPCVSTNENLSTIFGTLFGVFFCIYAGLMIYIFHNKFSNKSRNNVKKNGKNEDYVTHYVPNLDDHKYHGIDGDATETGHQENSAHYEVLGSRDPENVYDRVKDVNAGVVTQSYKDKSRE
ncbi:uncharacterized protein LOC134250565 [Saccostrea cucullata]|uniref:uncharacterized protein LOC134250565 n=1 Tax=Saccostrea cuccullata TaxID=36930 RepID=UPI002ED0CFBD